MSRLVRQVLSLLTIILCAPFLRSETLTSGFLFDLGDLNESTWSEAAEKGRLGKDVLPLLKGRFVGAKVSKNGNYALLLKYEASPSSLMLPDNSKSSPSSAGVLTEKFAQTVKSFCGKNAYQNDIVLKDQKNKKSIHLLQYVFSYRRNQAAAPEIECAALVVFRNDYRDREEFSLWLDKQLTEKCSQVDFLDVTELLGLQKPTQGVPPTLQSEAIPPATIPLSSNENEQGPASPAENPNADIQKLPESKPAKGEPVPENPTIRKDNSRFVSELKKAILSNDSKAMMSAFERNCCCLDDLNLPELTEVLNALMTERPHHFAPVEKIKPYFGIDSVQLVNRLASWLEGIGFPVSVLDPAFTRNINGLLYVQVKQGWFGSRPKKVEDPLHTVYRDNKGLFELEMVNDSDPRQGYMEKRFTNILDLVEMMRIPTERKMQTIENKQ